MIAYARWVGHVAAMSSCSNFQLYSRVDSKQLSEWPLDEERYLSNTIHVTDVF